MRKVFVKISSLFNIKKIEKLYYIIKKNKQIKKQKRIHINYFSIDHSLIHIRTVKSGPITTVEKPIHIYVDIATTRAALSQKHL